MQRSRPLAFCPSLKFPAASFLAPPALWLAVGCLLPGCTAPADNNSHDAGADLSAYDAGADLSARCALPYDQRAIDQVATGAVTVMPEPGDPATFTAQLDATAGGASSYGKNPFVYLDLIGGKKVELTDVQAEQSGDWDLAFKRWQIKVNGGSSGPGTVAAAIVPDKTLAEVTAAPAGPYATDSYFDAQCQVQLDSIDGLQTVLSDWYDYDTGTMRLMPKKQVIVLTRRDHKGHIKVQLTAYYKGTVSANYALSWSLLP